jgi:hypothetical protein
MRLISLAAAVLALGTAAPAAAQLDADSIALGAIQQLTANHGEVRDYTLLLAYGPVRVPIYVHQSGGAWQVAAPPEPALAEMMSAAVIWPAMLSEMTGKAEGDMDAADLSTASAGYLGTETVGGRRAHVLFARFDGAELPDSVNMYVDVETRQMLRLDVRGALPEADLAGSDVRMSLELGDYRERNGLTLPMRLRLRMEGDLGFSPKERQSMREDLPDARARAEAMEGSDREQGLATVALFEGLLLHGVMDMELTVEEVRVNAGAPRWMKELDQP